MNYNDMLSKITEKQISIIYGFNFTGKTYLLKKLYNDLKKSNNAILLPSNRKFGLSKEEINSVDAINLLNNNFNIIDFIKFRYGIEDLFSLESIKKGDSITSGYIQIVNYFYTISLYCNEILLVDNFEINLHPILLKELLYDIVNIFKIKHLIITTPDIDKYDINFNLIDNIKMKNKKSFSNDKFNIINIKELNID